MQELGQAEIQRIMKQKEELKEEELRLKQDILEAAIRDNEVGDIELSASPPPPSLPPSPSLNKTRFRM